MIWATVFRLVVMLIISYATQPKVPRPKPAAFDEFEFPTAEEGTPQCVVFGDCWVEDWFVNGLGNYRSRAIKKGGGLFTSSQTVGYHYYFDIHAGICRGPVDEIVEIKNGDKTVWKYVPGAELPITPEEEEALSLYRAAGSIGPTSSLVRRAKEFEETDHIEWPFQITGNTRVQIKARNIHGGEDGEGGVEGYLDVMFGAADQEVNADLEAMTGELTPAYRGKLTTFYSGLVCSISRYPKPWKYRVRRVESGWQNDDPWYVEKAVIWLEDNTIKAMNPIHMMYEAHTNSAWGRGIPTSLMGDSWLAAADTVFAEGFGLCIRWTRQSSVRTFIDEIGNTVGANVFLHPRTGKIEIVLIRDDYDVEALPLYTFDTGLLGIDDDESSATVVSANTIIVGFKDPVTNTERNVRVDNLASIDGAGHVQPQTLDYPAIPTAELALRAGQRELRARNTGVKRLKVRLDRRAYELLPGSVFRISAPEQGIEEIVLRAGKVEIGKLGNAVITVDAVQDVFGLPATSYVKIQPSGWTPPNTAPTPIETRRMVELSYYDLAVALAPYDLSQLDDAAGYGAAIAVRPTSVAEGYALQTRVDTDEFVERTDGDFCPSAVLVNDMQPGKEIVVAAVASAVDFDQLVVGTPALVDDELFHLVGFNPDGSSVSLARGCGDTVPAFHAAGSRVWLYGNDFVAVDATQYANGTTLDLRLITRAPSGMLVPSLADIDELVFAQRQVLPYPPGDFQIDAESYPAEKIGDFTVTWAHRDRLEQDGTLIDTSAGDIGPEPGTTYAVIVRRAANDSALQSHTEIAGSSQAVTGVAFSGPIKVQLFSQRDGLDSWQAHECVMNYIPSPIVVSSADIPVEPVENGTALTVNFLASPGQVPFTWEVSAGGLPTGMSLGAGTGELTGTPTADGTFDFTIDAEDKQGFSGDEEFQIVVTSLPMILGGEAPDGELFGDYLFEPYTINIDGPVTWSLISGELPDGVTVDSATGVVSGTVGPTAGGEFTFEIEADGSATATREYTINISGSVGRYFPHLYDGTEFIMSVRVELPQSMGGGVDNWITHSTDADTWTLEQETVADGIRTMVYGLGKYVAQGGPFGNVISMADAVDEEWTTESVDSDVIDGLLFDGSRFVVSGERGIILTRTDVTGWSEVTPHDLENAGELTIRSMVWDGTYYFCSAREEVPSNPDLHQVWRSTDLITWTKQFEIDATDGVIARVQMANGLLFICGSQTIPAEPALRPWLMASADDGGTWTDYSPTTVGSFAMPINDIVYFDGLYVLLAYNLNAYASTLGTWTTNEPTVSEINNRPVTDGTTLIAWRMVDGSENQLVKTIDGMVWTVFEP